MSIILLGLYLFITRDTIAVPIEDYTSDSLSRNFTLAQVASECVCPSDQRTVWDIIWSCLATTFLCTWVTVHPNIPAPDEEWWWIAWTRLKTMFWALVAPELIFLWALRQYVGAKYLKDRYADQYPHWTMVHGHFLQMGGFMLYDKDGKPDRTLLEDDFYNQLDQNFIKFPSITEEQIMDKSKGDALAKLLTLLQTGWFIAQCIARRSQHLAISELELTTLALATVNLFIYIFWWKKPLDVRQPVPVHLLSEDHSAECISLTVKPEDWWHHIIKPLVSIARDIRKCLWHSFKKSGLLLTILHVLLLWPIVEPAVGLIYSPASSPTSTLRQAHNFYFYAQGIEIYSGYFSTVIAAAFGAIHCTAWTFVFPSFTEQVLWRASSVTVAAFPLLIAFFYFMRVRQHDRKIWSNIWLVLEMVPVVVYPLARLILLVEGVTTLRQLPPTAYDNIQWLDFIPHI